MFMGLAGQRIVGRPTELIHFELIGPFGGGGHHRQDH